MSYKYFRATILNSQYLLALHNIENSSTEFLDLDNMEVAVESK